MQTGGDWSAKKFTLATVVFALLVGIAAVAPAQANQILNGSFETPVIPPAGVQPIGVGGEPPGFEWTVVTNSVDIVSNGHGGPCIIAQLGVQFLDLVGLGIEFGSGGAIQQTFATVLGQQYTFSIAYANNLFETASASADITITDGSNTLLSQSITHDTSTTSNLDWTPFSQSFIATGTTATLLLNNTVGEINGGILLDNVHIDPTDPTLIPLPGAVWLLGSGLLALAGFGRRLRQKA